MKNFKVVVLPILALSFVLGFGPVCSKAEEYEIKQRIIEFRADAVGVLLGSDTLDPQGIKKMSEKLFALPVEQMIQRSSTQDIAPEVSNNTFYVSGKKIRVDTTEEKEKLTSMALLDEGKVYTIFWAKKQYMELSIDRIQQMQKQASEALKKLPAMEEALKNMPPEIRAQMEANLGKTQVPTSEVKITKTGRSATINGFGCEEYLAEAQTGETQLCVSKEFPALRKSFDLFMEAFPGFEGLTEEQNTEKILKEIPDGWPILMKELAFDPLAMEFSFDVTEILSVEKKDLPPDTFRVPTDFMKVATPVQ